MSFSTHHWCDAEMAFRVCTVLLATAALCNYLNCFKQQMTVETSSVSSYSHESAADLQVGSEEEAGHAGSEGHRSTGNPKTYHQLPLLSVSLTRKRSWTSALKKDWKVTELLWECS